MSVRTGLPSPTAGSIKEFSAALAVVSTKQLVLVLKGSLLNRGLWYICFCYRPKVQLLRPGR